MKKIIVLVEVVLSFASEWRKFTFAA